MESQFSSVPDNAVSNDSFFSSMENPLPELFSGVQATIDEAMASIGSHASSLGRAAVGEGAVVAGRTRDVIETGKAHLLATLEQADDALITTLKQGILYGIDHQIISAASISAVAMLSVPAVRRALYTKTIGRFTSQEQLLKNSESSVTTMLGDLNIQKNEIEKLGERLTLAKDEYARGKAKLAAAAREMRSLESRVGKSERKAKDLLYEIRGIRAKGALQLRSDAAVVVEAAKTQRKQVEKIVYKLESHGL